jgi:pyrophosphatase PpaX
MIKAVIFDVDGVLIDSFAANLKFYQDLLTAAGYVSPTKEELKNLFHMTMEGVIRVLIKSDNPQEIKRVWLMGKDRAVDYPDELLITPDNYVSVIRKLYKKYKLGIVTSRIRGYVFNLPQLSNLEKYFSDAVYFEDTEKHKPDPSPLLLSAKRLGFKQEEMIYVGDTESDIQAAQAANMKMILFSKINLPGATASTSFFGKLPDLVATIN